MLLDKYVLTKGLTTFLAHSPSATESANASFTKRVHSSMARIDPLLKTLQVRPSPPEGLVQAYLIHIQDRSDANFRKILDLKGVRKTEQAALVEMFVMHRDGKSNEHLVAQNTLLTPLLQPAAAAGTGLGLSMGAAAGAPAARFDAQGFGEKLFSAARDGVQGLGTGGAGMGMGQLGGEEAKAVVESNLKNLGRFFRKAGAKKDAGAG